MWSSHGKNIGRRGRNPGVGHSFVPDSTQDKTLWYSVSPKKGQAQTYRLAHPNQICKLPGAKLADLVGYSFSRIHLALEVKGDRRRARAVSSSR